MTSVLSPDRWERVVALFEEASALPAEARAALLDEACRGDADLRREVDSLLVCDVPHDLALDSRVSQALAEAAAGVPTAAPPTERIGPYRLISEIGRGGMGAVYLADRDDELRQRVAINV